MFFIFNIWLKKACEHHQQEEALGCFPQDPSCSLLTDLHHGPALEEPTATGASGDPVKMGVQDSPLLSPVFSLISTSSAPSETSDESPHTARLKTDDPCVQSPSADHCKVGWWRQDAETHGASGGLVSAAEPRAAFTSGEEFCMLQYVNFGQSNKYAWFFSHHDP